jgi:hypothetical protein
VVFFFQRRALARPEAAEEARGHSAAEFGLWGGILVVGSQSQMHAQLSVIAGESTEVLPLRSQS